MDKDATITIKSLLNKGVCLVEPGEDIDVALVLDWHVEMMRDAQRQFGPLPVTDCDDVANPGCCEFLSLPYRFERPNVHTRDDLVHDN